MKVVFHEAFLPVYAADPAAAAGRLEAVLAALPAWVELTAPEPAAEEDIAAAHGTLHIERVRRAGLFDVAALAAGGAIQAARLGLEAPAFGLIRPPGHHASAESAWGFCHFNNMAVAVLHLMRRGGIRSALVLDIDLHYGDGTVNILVRVEGVRVVNPEAADRQGYLRAVAGALEAHPAELIGVSAGFDNHLEDWGGLLATADYRRIGRLVRQAAENNAGGCFGILEGGYNHAVLGRNVAAFLEGLGGRPGIG